MAAFGRIMRPMDVELSAAPPSVRPGQVVADRILSMVMLCTAACWLCLHGRPCPVPMPDLGTHEDVRAMPIDGLRGHLSALNTPFHEMRAHWFHPTCRRKLDELDVHLRVGYGNVYAHSVTIPTPADLADWFCSDWACKALLTADHLTGAWRAPSTPAVSVRVINARRGAHERLRRDVHAKVTAALLAFIRHVGSMNLTTGVSWVPLTPEVLMLHQHGMGELVVTIDRKCKRAHHRQESICISPGQISGLRSWFDDVLLHELAHYCAYLLSSISPSYYRQHVWAYKTTLQTVGLYAQYDDASYVSADADTRAMAERDVWVPNPFMPWRNKPYLNPATLARTAEAEHPWHEARELEGMAFTLLLDPRFKPFGTAHRRWDKRVQDWYVSIYKPLRDYAS